MDPLLRAAEDLRRQRYHQTPAAQVRTADEARQFINEVGFCLFYPHADLLLPNLRDATAGDPHEAEGHNWGWKDELAGARQVFYGRPYRGTPGFVALDLLAPLYAVSPVADVGGDARELLWAGSLTAEAHRIAETVADKGPLSTRALRRESGLLVSKYRFTRAVSEAQENYLIAMTRATSATRAGYNYIWDSFPRAWPDAEHDGARLSIRDAAATIISRYIGVTVAATTATIAHVFSLDTELVEDIVRALVEQGTLKLMVDDDARWLVSGDLMPPK
jgi:hypothetical protein